MKQVAAALTQVSSSSIAPDESKRIIDAFLNQDPDDENLAVPALEANVYVFQAQGIVEMLDKLGTKSRMSAPSSRRRRQMRAMHLRCCRRI